MQASLNPNTTVKPTSEREQNTQGDTDAFFLRTECLDTTRHISAEEKTEQDSVESKMSV